MLKVVREISIRVELKSRLVYGQNLHKTEILR